MVIEADFYRIRLRFKRLFADPAIFDDQKNAVRRFLGYSSSSNDQTDIYQITDDISPSDNVGKSPEVAGTARYVHGGRVVRSEYLENANVTLEYADFGSGLLPSGHQKIWKRQKSAAAQLKVDVGLAEDERVEDAGLEFEDEVDKPRSGRGKAKIAA